MPNVLTGFDAFMMKMASRMWAPSIVMGLMIIVIAFFVGLSNSASVTEYFSASKVVREAAISGSALVSLKVSIEVIKTWLPPFKFMGMAFLFSGITFALAIIILTLKNAGIVIQKKIGVEPQIPKKPWYAHVFPLFMAMGLMTLIGTFIVGVWLAGIAGGYWDHSIATELNPAAAGSAFLAQLQLISSVKAWLAPLKFIGVASLLTGISLALYTIRFTLRKQTITLLDLLDRRRA